MTETLAFLFSFLPFPLYSWLCEDRHLRAHHRRPSLLVLVLSQTCALPRGTGIVREKLGDIILQGEKGAHVLVVPELVDFLTTTLDKDRYLQLEDQASQTQEGGGEPPVVDKVALFYEAAGGEKKHRVYEIGSQKSVFYPQSSCSSSTGIS
ncbi:hypothetical protein J5N97_022699 [Dioscorea zingiberensis]|uniref:Uncharacterized protein n=1 Tax=Dioscorea zingiberensis TaxID=325984 RepID=A0A9D5CC46_9LILI|nr:hypothetical protein J5N97_022699 [Dioscorea zingiberensis]